ncbi:uncharacterized protein LOC126574465 isoform X1 [Anopheles aquasalis]|uniref:uncharacterized protein LOC126574465 isoform X1 n=1 Tax=Anopheles aquasalis TaxID=42839 RepID=UPI00215AAD7B|nr:uncharacterized protein LOC126574465 isoform X1 [Anopheles aquasalis]XP_050090641.1 uncharacterized protein LOC126574465 isoform X1 [Anopheles aquasalis]
MANVSCWRILTRRKVLTYDGGSEKLGRILNTFDLTALGVGATLGVGVYVLAGHVSKDQAGPSVVLSFLIAAAASFLAGLCYAEFGARVPKSGSAYIYSYVCIGEFMAFIIGWNLMLEYIIGSASVSRGLSLYIDTLANDTMKVRFREVAPIEWDFMSEYFDFFAFSVAILLGIALAFGLKKSTMVNNAFTVLNIFIVLFVIVAGAINADLDNWRITPESVPAMYNAGEGGFFPFGFEGTLRGAATCFFGFVGFDCIATTGEEVRNPRRAIPRAILLSLCTIFLAYFGVSTVLTLMWPYYKQDVNAPLPHVFNEIGWNFAKWIVAIGGIIGLVASLFGAMFPQPRIIYAMAQDGLIFRALGEVSPRFKTPVFGTLCAALLTGTLGGLFDLKALVNMLSIGTLMAYTVVAISILILRFSDNPDPAIPSTSRDTYESSNLLMARERVTGSLFCKQLFNLSCIRLPTNVSSRVVSVLVTVYCLLSIALALTIYYAKDAIYEMEVWAWILFGVLLGCTLLVLLLISIQPREHADAPFRVPLVPLLPGISIFVNIYLMLMLDIYTWIRFGIWMAVGLVMYLICACCYGERGVKNVDVRVPHSQPAVPATDHYRDGSTLENGSIGEQSLEDAATYHQSRSFANQNGGYYSRNLSAAIETEMVGDPRELKPRMLPTSTVAGEAAKLGPTGVPVAISTESEEEQSHTKSSKISNTSNSSATPKSSFDEILPLSELADEFTEKIEPNGKVYFVAQTAEERIGAREEGAVQRRAVASEASPIAEPISLTVEKETSKAIAFLDNILDDEDTVVSGEEPPSSGEYVRTRGDQEGREDNDDDDDDDDGASSSLASPVFRDQSVVADIHRTLDSIGESTTSEQPNEPSLPIVLPVVIPTPTATEPESRTEIEQQNSDESKLEARSVPVKIVTQPQEDQRSSAKEAPSKLKPRAMYVDKGSEDDGTMRKVLTEDEQEFINFRPVDKDQFKSRLSVLLINQKPNPLASKKVGEGGTTNPDASAARMAPQANRPSMSRSTSEPSFVLLLNKLGGGGESPQESETDEPEEKARSEHSSLAPVAIPPAPKFDQTLFNTIRAGAIPSTPRTPIPEAPKFDPVLYNTLGKGKAQRESILPDAQQQQQQQQQQQEKELEQMNPVTVRPVVAAAAATVPVTPPGGKYYEVELKKLKRIAPSVPVQTSKEAEPDPESNPRQAFKSRLEQILQRGPLEVPGRPKTLTPSLMGAISADNIAAPSRISLQQRQQQLPGASSTDSGLGMLTSSTVSVSSTSDSTEGSVITSENVGVKRDESFRDRARGFDTAKKKQKLIFDDVLKSINPETRPSSIRNSVEHRVSFRNFKEGLRKTVPPKQFLPDA